MIGGAGCACLMKVNYLNSVLCLTLILVMSLAFQVTVAWGIDYTFSFPTSDEVDPWMGWSFEVTIDGERTDCDHVDCADSDGDTNIPTVVEGQQLKVAIDCAYGDDDVDWS